MAPELQAKLLRALEDKRVRPVGSDESVPLDVRIVAATNTDLSLRIQESRFREDLYYRLAVLPIHLPPLRERREDIPLLADHFLHRAAAAAGKRIPGFAPEAMAALLRQLWPGNVRELENVVERSVALTGDAPITPEALLLDAAPAPHAALTLARMPQRPTLRALTDEYVGLVLRETSGDKERAAEILGISKRTLYRWDRPAASQDGTPPADPRR